MLPILFLSCKKEKGTVDQPPTPDVATAKVLLKDMVVPNLPSPNYHFEYNADSTVAVASYASDFRKYNIAYAWDRISAMTNDIAGLQERVEYLYDNAGRVIQVNYINVLGILDTKVFFTYDGKKLTKLERQRILGSEFVVNKVMTFFYYEDGNLKEIIDHRPAVDGRQVESTSSDKFARYDDKINVDGFSLLHNDFFDHLLILPGVQLQKNNPGREILTSDNNSLEINYTYTYNDKNLPMSKQGEVTITAGASAGQTLQTNCNYTYY
jgi:hypothetical protein